MTAITWTDEMLEVLMEMADRGCIHREIADYLGISRPSVASKMINLGLLETTESFPQPVAPIWFPTFENITPTEARRISAGSPRSGRFSPKRPEYFSGVGCAALMCMA